LLGCVVTVGSQSALAKEQRGGNDKIDEDADRILHKMCDFMGSLKSFSFVGKSTTDVVTDEGQKISFGATSDVEVQRPNHLRSDRVGSATNTSLYYDGNTITLLGRKMNLYATADAPHDLDGAIDFARDRLGLEAPAADLLYKDPYAALTEDVIAGKVVGREFLDGVPVQHLAFRGHEVDFQIWIEDGARPVPRRYVITSKNVTGVPDFEVELGAWRFEPTITADTFRFKAPPGAQKIDFMATRAVREELKRNP